MKRIDLEEYSYDYICKPNISDYAVGVILIRLFFESGEIFSSVRQKEDLADDDRLLQDYCKLKNIYVYVYHLVYNAPCWGIKFSEGILDAMHTISCKFRTLINAYEEFSPGLIKEFDIFWEQQELEKERKKEEAARKEEERKRVEEEERKERERVRKEIEEQVEEEERLRDVEKAKRVMKVYRKEQRTGENLHILYDDDEWYDAVEDAQETLSEDRRIKAKRKREAKKNEINQSK